MVKFINNCAKIGARTMKMYKNKKEGPYTGALQLKTKIDEFSQLMPLILKLRHPGIRTRHWEMIAKDIGFRGKIVT
jgi:hypothetical protein